MYEYNKHGSCSKFKTIREYFETALDLRDKYMPLCEKQSQGNGRECRLCLNSNNKVVDINECDLKIRHPRPQPSVDIMVRSERLAEQDAVEVEEEEIEKEIVNQLISDVDVNVDGSGDVGVGSENGIGGGGIGSSNIGSNSMGIVPSILSYIPTRPIRPTIIVSNNPNTVLALSQVWFIIDYVYI